MNTEQEPIYAITVFEMNEIARYCATISHAEHTFHYAMHGDTIEEAITNRLRACFVMLHIKAGDPVLICGEALEGSPSIMTCPDFGLDAVI